MALTGQLAELRASEHAVRRAARAEAAERVAPTERAARAAVAAARTEAAEEKNNGAYNVLLCKLQPCFAKLIAKNKNPTFESLT